MTLTKVFTAGLPSAGLVDTFIAADLCAVVHGSFSAASRRTNGRLGVDENPEDLPQPESATARTEIR
jgi:hypothetical protein